KTVNFLQQDVLRPPCYGRRAIQHRCVAVQVGDARGGLSRGIDRELVESTQREGRLFDGAEGRSYVRCFRSPTGRPVSITQLRNGDSLRVAEASPSVTSADAWVNRR